MNTKLQGNIGLGQAIAYFTRLGYIVSLPLNDSQKYDLIVDDGSSLKRVSVKTSRYKADSGSYYVLLKQAGGSRKAATSTNFNNTSADLLFVWCADDSRYLIPCPKIPAKSAIVLGSKWQQYRL
jgi:hypothetical protein